MNLSACAAVVYRPRATSVSSSSEQQTTKTSSALWVYLSACAAVLCRSRTTTSVWPPSAQWTTEASSALCVPQCLCCCPLQIQSNKCVASQCTTDYRGTDYTASLTAGNIDIVSGSGQLPFFFFFLTMSTPASLVWVIQVSRGFWCR